MLHGSGTWRRSASVLRDGRRPLVRSAEGKSDYGRFGRRIEQLLPIRLAVSRQPEHQAFGGSGTVPCGEVTENICFALELFDNRRSGRKPASLDEHPHVLGAADRLRPVRGTGNYDVAVIPGEIADGEAVLLTGLPAGIAQEMSPGVRDHRASDAFRWLLGCAPSKPRDSGIRATRQLILRSARCIAMGVRLRSGVPRHRRMTYVADDLDQPGAVAGSRDDGAGDIARCSMTTGPGWVVGGGA
jgi:hypothetical protein